MLLILPPKHYLSLFTFLHHYCHYLNLNYYQFLFVIAYIPSSFLPNYFPHSKQKVFFFKFKSVELIPYLKLFSCLLSLPLEIRLKSTIQIDPFQYPSYTSAPYFLHLRYTRLLPLLSVDGNLPFLTFAHTGFSSLEYSLYSPLFF